MQGLNELKGFLFEGGAEAPSVIIYAPNISARLRYVSKFIFNQGLLCNFVLTDNESEFINSKLPKINYSIKTFESALNINPSGLLNQNKVQSIPGDYPDDIFSSVFYHISRYEEWISQKRDEHGRFIPETIFNTPVVDIKISEFKTILLSKFKTLQFTPRKFKFISTIDVDNVYAYQAKPLYRQIGGALKDLARFDLVNLGNRVGTILGHRKDPFDEYDLHVDLSDKYKIPLIYFFLYRNNKKYDRTIDPKHPGFLKLLRFLNYRTITFGLHPSYDSSTDPSLLDAELKLLSKNAGHQIICSRQHFLRFDIRTTPKALLRAGVQYDFTMGWAHTTGFRAGTTLPFFYYDLDSENELKVMAVPFAAMDGAFYVYKTISATQAIEQLMELANTIKAVNGLFITVIHERSFSDAIAPGWKDLYIKLHENLAADFTD